MSDSNTSAAEFVPDGRSLRRLAPVAALTLHPSRSCGCAG
jgi:hypothetical protein